VFRRRRFFDGEAITWFTPADDQSAEPWRLGHTAVAEKTATCLLGRHRWIDCAQWDENALVAQQGERPSHGALPRSLILGEDHIPGLL
jgi:hypothetical protein